MIRKGLLIILVVISLGCRKMVDVDYESIESIPVVNSIFKSGNKLEIHASFTGPIDTSRLKIIPNMKIDLFRDDVFIENLLYHGNGLYHSNSVISVGTYSIEANLEGYDKLFSKSTIPHANKITSVKHISNSGVDYEGVSYPGVEFEFENDPNEILFYEVKLRYFRGDEVFEAEIINITDSLILREGLPIPIFSNKHLRELTYRMKLNYTTNSQMLDGDSWVTELYPFVIELRTVSEEYYNFVKQLYLYEQGRFPENFGDVANVYPIFSNVRNGRGIFAGYNSFESHLIIP